jgi:hypothetical protein
VDVEDAERRYIEHRLLEDLSVASEDADLGRHGPELFDGLAGADALGLEDREIVFEREHLHGRRLQLTAATSPAIRLSVHADNFVLAADKTAERRQGELG